MCYKLSLREPKISTVILYIRTSYNYLNILLSPVSNLLGTSHMKFETYSLNKYETKILY